MKRKILIYLRKWIKQDYKDGIPDEVPTVLMDLNLAPSYKAICIAILKNDHSMKSLGFSAIKSEWYNVFKKIELENRDK